MKTIASYTDNFNAVYDSVSLVFFDSFPENSARYCVSVHSLISGKTERFYFYNLDSALDVFRAQISDTIAFTKTLNKL